MSLNPNEQDENEDEKKYYLSFSFPLTTRFTPRHCSCFSHENSQSCLSVVSVSINVLQSFKLVPIHFVISLSLFRKIKQNTHTQTNTKPNKQKNAVYSEKHRRNEYGIGDQCRIYWPVLSAGSDSTNHCVAHGKIMSRKGITL